jgi:nucleoside-diphosphate-sugar epimerase
MNKTALITGAAGFIASHLAEKLLSEGYKVIGLDNFDDFYHRSIKEKNIERLRFFGKEKFEFHEMDLRNAADFELLPNKIDIVFHIAGKAGVRPSIEAPSDYIETNISGTQNVLDWMKNIQCDKLIFASSSSIYGNNKKVPFSESDDVNAPISPYAFTKRSNELQIHTFHHLSQLNAVCLRFFTVYGPRQRPDLAIRKFVTRIHNGEAIDQYGDGSTGRDYTYISDIINGVYSAANYLFENENVFEIINLGSHSPVSLKEMIDTIGTTLNKNPIINVINMQPGDVEITYADISKAKKLLGYEPKVSFEKGIKQFVDWFDKEGSIDSTK